VYVCVVCVACLLHIHARHLYGLGGAVFVFLVLVLMCVAGGAPWPLGNSGRRLPTSRRLIV